MYADFFLKTIDKNPNLLNQSLIEKIPDEKTRKQFTKIAELVQQGIVHIEDKIKYNSMIRDLYRLAHVDEYASILIGAIIYEGVRKEGKGVKSGKISDVFGIGKSIDHNLSKINDTTLVKFVTQ